MTKVDVAKRWTLKQVKESMWYRDVVYTQEELAMKMAALGL
jgi:hypothetical protein